MDVIWHHTVRKNVEMARSKEWPDLRG